jgi:hypothetical protein
MKLEKLQDELNDERKGNRDLWHIIDATYNIKLGIADKFLIISQMNGCDYKCWDNIWLTAVMKLEEFGYKIN